MEKKLEVLEYINRVDYEPLTISELSEKLEMTLQETEAIVSDLLSTYDIFLSKKKDKILSMRLANTYKGVISIRNKDYGFVTNPIYPDIYVSWVDWLDAMNGDTVLYKIILDDYSRPQAIIKEIIKRKSEYLVGEVRYFRGKNYLIPSNNNVNSDVLIKNNNIKIKAKDIIRGRITKYSPYIEVMPTEVLGSVDSVGIDIIELLASYDIKQEFDKDVLDECNNLEVTKEEINRRTKFLDKEIYTIDSIKAKDLDDAISIKRLENGNYELGVYIADVSYFVKEDSFLDKEALDRGCSIYLLNKVIPMLPVRLSNDLASLNPNEEKLVIALIMEVNHKGDVVDKKFYEGVIKTTKRLSYEACNKVLEEGTTNYPDYESVLPSLNLMVELQGILEEKRIKRGAINFDIDEAEITLDDALKVINIDIASRGISEKVIEEFMILANETVASTFDEMDLPFIYRVHDKPDEIKFMNLKSIVTGLGYHLNHDHPKEIQKLIESLDDKDYYLKDTILRLMAKAVYDTENIGHYGLASRAYTHFTSPIRRYPDLIVHRLIRKYLFNNDNVIDYETSLILRNNLSLIAKLSSERERISNDLEFKVIDMKKAEYMANFIGYTYEAYIASVHKFGVFVNIGKTIEGLVHVSKLNDEYFYFDEKSNSYYNQISKKELRVGSIIRVKLINSDKKSSEIDFDLVYNGSRGRKPWKR